MRRSFVWCLLPLLALGANPLLPQPGMADPHVHVWEPQGGAKRVWMYATHDTPAGAEGTLGFRMDNWWVWSSTDLVHWVQEDILWPTTTYAHANRTDCWATDAAAPGPHPICESGWCISTAVGP